MLAAIAACFQALAPQAALATDQRPMTFRVIDAPGFREANRATLGDGVAILASGSIQSGTVDRLRRLVRDRGIKSATIYFDSSGGLMDEGMALGRMIRALRFNTDIGRPTGDAVCASACADAYAGGVGRFLTARSGPLGIHQFATRARPSRETEKWTQLASAEYIDYLAEMGVDPRLFSLASMTDANDISWLSPDTALRLRLANNGAEPAIAEIGTTGMRPYLMVQQRHHDMTSRALFFCLQGRLAMTAALIVTPERARAWAAGSTQAYVELDGRTEMPGADGAEAISDRVTFTRAIPAEMARRLIDTREMAIRVRSGGAVRGQTLDLRPGRQTMRDFFRQCLPASSADSARDLVVTSIANNGDRHSMMMIDRNSIIRAGTLIRARVYGAAIEGKEQIASIALSEFDCDAHRSRDLSIGFHQLDGTLLTSDKRGWTSVAPGSGVEATLLTACGKLRPDGKMEMGDEDPFELIRLFVDVGQGDWQPPRN